MWLSIPSGHWSIFQMRKTPWFWSFRFTEAKGMGRKGWLSYWQKQAMGRQAPGVTAAFSTQTELRARILMWALGLHPNGHLRPRTVSLRTPIPALSSCTWHLNSRQTLSFSPAHRLAGALLCSRKVDNTAYFHRHGSKGQLLSSQGSLSC